ncbi:MAG: hypothetical protein AAF771_02060 [Pseudomonadota bacterium]
MTHAHANPPPPKTIWGNWGIYAVLSGALGLALVFLEIWLQMNTPQAPVTQQIGEMAGEIRRTAWRGFLGLPPEPAAPAETIPFWRQYLPLAGPVLGIVAVVLSLISALRHEDRRFTAYALGLGTSAIVFQAFWWVLLVVAGVFLLISILQNMDGIFGG